MTGNDARANTDMGDVRSVDDDTCVDGGCGDRQMHSSNTTKNRVQMSNTTEPVSIVLWSTKN